MHIGYVRDYPLKTRPIPILFENKLFADSVPDTAVSRYKHMEQTLIVIEKRYPYSF